MTVHRQTPLVSAPPRGRLIVAEQVIGPTIAALRSSGGSDDEHEGLVLWLGRTTGTSTIVTTMICPPARTGRGYVFVDERAVAAASRAARRCGLGVVAQVHSHPGRDTRHSDGDDHLITMPYENMYSLVVGLFGRGGLLPRDGAGLHQYQDGHWIRVIGNDAMLIAPASASSPDHGSTDER